MSQIEHPVIKDFLGDTVQFVQDKINEMDQIILYLEQVKVNREKLTRYLDTLTTYTSVKKSSVKKTRTCKCGYTTKQEKRFLEHKCKTKLPLAISTNENNGKITKKLR